MLFKEVLAIQNLVKPKKNKKNFSFLTFFLKKV